MSQIMSDTMVCPRCAAITASNSRFCSSCGASLAIEGGEKAVASAVAPSDRLSDSGAIQLKNLLEDAVGGEYIVHEELGRGGMAVVYKATEVHLSRTVAIKVLPPDLTFAKGTTERFQREAKTAAGLDHPNIIPIYRISSQGKLFWYAMKFLQGRSLGDVISEKGILTVSEAIAILEQVASALDYAHQRSVIHRDIKPGNVMLDVNGRVTVTDFGIAKELTGSGLTGSGAILGTPYYMSPEQCRGSQDLTGGADQYSLGVMTYQMITGQLPFEADSAIDVIHKHVSEPPPPLDKLLPTLPRHVINAVNRSMAKKPAERFPTVMGFIGALKNQASDATLIVNKRPTGLRLTAPESRSFLKRRALRAVAALVVLGVLGFGGAMMYQRVKQSPDLSAESSPPPGPSISAPGTPPSTDSVSRSVATAPPAGPVAPPPAAAPTQPSSAPVRTEASGSTTPPAPPAAPRPSRADSGTVRIAITNGWANIALAGQVLEQRRVWTGRLPAGSYPVTFSRDGYQTLTRNVTVRPGQESPLTVTMTPRP